MDGEGQREAVVRRCSAKKVFLEILQSSQENICANRKTLVPENIFYYRPPLAAASGQSGEIMLIIPLYLHLMTISIGLQIFSRCCSYYLLLLTYLYLSLREKCPYSELFWSVFSRIRTEYEGLVFSRIQSKCGKIWTRKTPNTDTFHAVFHEAMEFHDSMMRPIL